MGTIRGQYSDNPWKTKLRVSQAEKKYLSKCLARKNVSIALLELAFKKEKTAHQLLRSQRLKTEQILGDVPLRTSISLRFDVLGSLFSS